MLLSTPTHCRWIGNAAEDGKMGTVFARLKVAAPDGSGALDDHGVHAFIVPLRDEESQCFPGVEIKDCGYKVNSLQPVQPVPVPACMLATTCSTVSTRPRLHYSQICIPVFIMSSARAMHCQT